MYLTENNTDETDRKILTALCSISCNVMFNKYALENINLGLIKPGDKVPYEGIRELHFAFCLGRRNNRQ